MVDMVDIRTNDPDINKYSIKFLRGKKMIVTNKRDFKYKIISISRELFHVSARGGGKGGVATSVLINVGNVLLMSSDLIKSFFVHTHAQLLAKRHGPAWSMWDQIIVFTHISMLSPSQDPNIPK